MRNQQPSKKKKMTLLLLDNHFTQTWFGSDFLTPLLTKIWSYYCNSFKHRKYPGRCFGQRRRPPFYQVLVYADGLIDRGSMEITALNQITRKSVRSSSRFARARSAPPLKGLLQQFNESRDFFNDSIIFNTMKFHSNLTGAPQRNPKLLRQPELKTNRTTKICVDRMRQ